MTRFQIRTLVRNLSVAGLAAVSFSGAAFGDSFLASFLGPGVQTPQGITTNFETFDSITPGSTQPFTTNFNGSSYTGTYSGDVNWNAANQFGGAGGTGTYPVTFTDSGYTLTLNKGANYFGLWISALDLGNVLQFFNNGTLVDSFTPADLIKLVGNCPGGAFCGNPNSSFLHDNASQQYAYVNFFDESGAFNTIVFSELNHLGGFESDNQAVAMLSAPPGGTPITTLPEPAMLAFSGLVFLAAYAGLKRLRRNYKRHY